jgi:hypothetical protein
MMGMAELEDSHTAASYEKLLSAMSSCPAWLPRVSATHVSKITKQHLSWGLKMGISVSGHY